MAQAGSGPPDSGLPLSALAKGAAGVVLALHHAGAQERTKLMGLGLVPGAEVRVLQRFPSYVLAVGFTQIAVDRQTADLIRVERL